MVLIGSPLQCDGEELALLGQSEVHQDCSCIHLYKELEGYPKVCGGEAQCLLTRI